MTLLSGSITQGQGHETVYKQLLCDRLGIDPGQVHYVQGDTDKVAIGEGTGGSRSAALGGSAVHLATEKIVTKAKAIAATMLGADADEIDFDDGIFSAPHSNRTLTIGEIASESLNPQNLPDGMEPRPDRRRRSSAARSRISRTAAISASSRSTRRPARSRSCATASSTMSAR